MYTIKEVAKIVGESEHTIRYYAKEGLFPFLTRDKNNVRLFSEADLEGVRIVLCLRAVNMPLQEIRHYMELCKQGNSTLEERLEIIQAQKKRATEEMLALQERIEHLEHKEQMYLNSIKGVREDLCNPLTERCSEHDTSRVGGKNIASHRRRQR